MKAMPIRTRQNDPDGLRSRLLDAAADLFQKRGYQATSIKDVMEATGVSGGALHHHFPTKRLLALAVIQDRVAPAVRETWIEPVKLASSLGKAVAGIFAGIESGVELRGSVSGCPLNNLALELSLADPDIRHAINSIFDEWQAALAERIENTGGGKRIGQGKRVQAAAFIVSVYSGAMALAKASQSAAPLRDVATVLSRWLREHDFAENAHDPE